MKGKLVTLISPLVGVGLILSVAGCSTSAQPTPTASAPTPVATATVVAGTAQPTIVAPTATTQTNTGAVASKSPRLETGTLSEAEKALGIKLAGPFYLPAGAKREDDFVRYYVQDGEAMASVAYLVGQRSLVLQYLKASADRVAESKGQPVKVGRHDGTMYTQAKEPSDPLPPTTTVTWRDGAVTYRVQGDLPAEELLKVARSFYEG